MDKIEKIRNMKGQELSKFLQTELNDLCDNIVRNPDELSQFVKNWTGGFHQYSLRNTILAMFQLQKPTTLLASYGAWKKKGRNVKKGEKGLRILAPNTRKVRNKETGEDEYFLSGFRVTSTFDYSQTEGDDIELGCDNLVSGEGNFEELKAISPVPVEMEYYGTANGMTDGKKILIAPKNRDAPMIATLFHEIAHIYLGHLKKDGFTDGTEINAHEVEAEAVSFICCSALGIENDKAKFYIGHWENYPKELSGRGQKVLSVAERIIRNISELEKGEN